MQWPYFTGAIIGKHVVDPLFDVTLGNLPGLQASDTPDPDWNGPEEKLLLEVDTGCSEAIDNKGDKERETSDKNKKGSLG